MADRQRSVEVKVRLNREGQLDVFRDLAEQIGDLEPVSEQAEQAVDKLGSSVERNFRGSTSAVNSARTALDEYRRQIEEVQRQGGVVTDEQLQKLQQLGDRYDDLVGKVGEYRTSQQRARKDIEDATKAAGGQVESFGSLGDAIDALGPKWSTMALKVVAVGEAFEFGFETGSKLRNLLNEITDGGFDQSIQNLFSGLTERLVGSADAVTLLQNQMNVLAKNGIDVAGKSAEEVGQIYEEFSAKLRANAAEVAANDEAFRKWRESLGPTRAELDELSQVLAQNVERLKETEAELSDVEWAAIVGSEVDQLVAQYARLGQEPPEHIRTLIEELARLREETGRATSEMADGWSRSKDEIERAVNELRASLRPIPDDLAAQAEAVGISIGAWERHNEVFTITPSKLQEAGDAAAELGRQVVDTAEATKDQAAVMESAGAAAGELAAPLSDAASATEALAGQSQKAAEGVTALRDQVDGLGAKIKGEFEGAAGFGAGFISELSLIASAAGEALAAVESLREAGEG